MHTFLDEDMMSQLKGAFLNSHLLTSLGLMCVEISVKQPSLYGSGGWARRSGIKQKQLLRGREHGIIRFARMRFKSFRWRLPALMEANRR